MTPKKRKELIVGKTGRLPVSPAAAVRAVMQKRVAKGVIERPDDDASQHVTPAGGNVFSDLGFPSEEAERLLRQASKPMTDAEAEALVRERYGVRENVSNDDDDILDTVRARLADKDRAVDVDIDDL